jgi:hypothetical protein
VDRLPAAVLVLGLPVALLAIVDRLGESPLGFAAGVVVLLGALAIVGAVNRRLDRWTAGSQRRHRGRSVGLPTDSGVPPSVRQSLEP